MRHSQLFTKTSKTAPKDADSINAQLLTRAGYIQKEAAGIYNFLPLGLMLIKNLSNIVREELNRIGGQEILLPVLTPQTSWKKTHRNHLDILFKTGNLVLNPTHEEVVTPLMQKYLSSYKDLPKAVYQIQTKFRNEPRAKSGLLRCREFLMKDMYSFHTDDPDQDRFYLEVKKAYEKIYSRLGIGERTIYTYASGGSFSKEYSHEFQMLSPIGEDEIFFCEKCRLGFNKEIHASQCLECGNKNLKTASAIEVGNIFKLKTKFSESFNFKFKDAKGKEKYVIMGCYGLGISRTLGALVEVFHDSRGIIWPESVSPFKIYLFSVGKDRAAEEIYQKYGNIFYDDRKEISVGEKMAEADLLGFPYRLIVSEKGWELKKRSEEKTKIINEKELCLLTTA